MSALAKTILVSLAAHSLTIWVTHAMSLDLSRWDAVHASAEPTDVWAGSSPLLDGLVDVDVQVDDPSTAKAKLSTSPSKSDPSPKGDTQPTEPQPTEPQPTEPQPTEPQPTEPQPADPPPQATQPTAPPPPPAVAKTDPRPPVGTSGAVKAEPTAAGSAAPRSEADLGGGDPSAFGAVGANRPRDIGLAFTRAIPPAAIRDRRWQSLPLGDTPMLEIDIYIDEKGHIASIRHLSEDPDEQLMSLVKKVYRLLEKSVFSLKEGQISEGRQRLQLRAHLEQLDVDPLEAETPTNLSFEYQNSKGKAGVTQPGGRRITVSVVAIATSGPSPADR